MQGYVEYYVFLLHIHELSKVVEISKVVSDGDVTCHTEYLF